MVISNLDDNFSFIQVELMRLSTPLLVKKNDKSEGPRQITVQEVLLRSTDAIFDFRFQ